MKDKGKIHILHSKLISHIFLFLFILLNVADFLGYLIVELDFFKKLLSWVIIGYLLYRVSFTKIFVGKKYRLYDCIFLFSFSFLVIPQILLYYLQIQNLGSPLLRAFLGMLVTWNFLGVLIILFSCLFLCKKDIIKKSFVGSFKLKKNSLKPLNQFLTLLSISLFFAFFIFKFFMEWFALAIDSIILVLGLFYYFFVFLRHTKYSKHYKYLEGISNFGNSLYEKTLLLFQDKKTFLKGVSLILAAHLVVDIGVFLIPYTTGLKNSLYLSSGHVPILSIADFGNSILGQIVFNQQINFGVKILSIIITTLITFGTYLIYLLPMIILLRKTNVLKSKGKYIFPKWILILLFLGILCAASLNLKVFNTITSPISFSEIKGSTLEGVDVITRSPILEISPINFSELLILSSAIFILGFLLFRHSKYVIYVQKLCIVFAVLFFTFYIFTFSTSYIKNYSNQDTFEKYLKIYNQNISHSDKIEFEKGEIMYFSTQNYEENSHNPDFILVSLNEKNHLKFFEKPYLEETLYKNFRFVHNKTYIIFNLTDSFNKEDNLGGHISEFKDNFKIKIDYKNLLINFFTLIFYLFGYLYFLKVSLFTLYKKD